MELFRRVLSLFGILPKISPPSEVTSDKTSSDEHMQDEGQKPESMREYLPYEDVLRHLVPGWAGNTTPVYIALRMRSPMRSVECLHECLCGVFSMRGSPSQQTAMEKVRAVNVLAHTKVKSIIDQIVFVPLPSHTEETKQFASKFLFQLTVVMHVVSVAVVTLDGGRVAMRLKRDIETSHIKLDTNKQSLKVLFLKNALWSDEATAFPTTHPQLVREWSYLWGEVLSDLRRQVTLGEWDQGMKYDFLDVIVDLALNLHV